MEKKEKEKEKEEEGEKKNQGKDERNFRKTDNVSGFIWYYYATLMTTPMIEALQLYR